MIFETSIITFELIYENDNNNSENNEFVKLRNDSKIKLRKQVKIKRTLIR